MLINSIEHFENVKKMPKPTVKGILLARKHRKLAKNEWNEKNASKDLRCVSKLAIKKIKNKDYHGRIINGQIRTKENGPRYAFTSALKVCK